ncbi:hypothetical protein CRI77_08845 [Mycolicibacterium duvalii]|nr:DUF4333 domain-containing protein [Mycolicibacterium duvalii]PEG42149.1 hypothetical protein CRI77_08845 [Mycolicibacterium duvalii]
MRKMGRAPAAVGALTLLAACTVPTPEGIPAVAPDDLEQDITARLVEAGQQPESVTCKDPLAGQVGQVARCEVVLSATNSFEPMITVTAVDGALIDYEMVPALSREQLQRAVARLVDGAGPGPTSTVACGSGLIGVLGATTACDVTTAGVTLRRTAEVDGVDGLMMSFDLLPLLTEAEVEGSLLDELATRLGSRPESADCATGLEGRPGNTVDCVVVSGPDTAEFTLTVTTVDGEQIDYTYGPKQ